MLKKITLFAAALLMLITLSGCSAKKETKHADVPPNLVVLGDSIACYGNAFPEMLEERYTAELKDSCGHETQNLSVGGLGIMPLVLGIRNGLYDDALKKADAVVVVIGGNNFCPALFLELNHIGVEAGHGILNTDRMDFSTAQAELEASRGRIDEVLDKFEDYLKEMAELIKKKTNGRVYFLTYYNVVSELPGCDFVSEFAEEYFDKFNGIIKSCAPGYYDVVDIGAAFKGRITELTGMGNSTDNHPNDAGSAVIADELDKAFRRDGFTYKQ